MSQKYINQHYTYKNIRNVETVTAMKAALKPGTIVEQIRFYPKQEFVFLYVQKVTTKYIVFKRLHDGRESELPLSPAKQFVFSTGIVGGIYVEQDGVRLFIIRPIDRIPGLDDADWSLVLQEIQKAQHARLLESAD